MSEITIGETPMETSFVGASAAPSHAPAVKPQRMPSNCSFRGREPSQRDVSFAEVTTEGMISILDVSVNGFQKQQSTDQNANRDPEVHIGENQGQPVAARFAIFVRFHPSLRPVA